MSRSNCKFGKAKNLRVRYGNYLKTFAPHQVHFRVVAVVDQRELTAAETCCTRRLSNYRLRGSTGYLHEWLVGIAPDVAVGIALEALTDAGIAHARARMEADG